MPAPIHASPLRSVLWAVLAAGFFLAAGVALSAPAVAQPVSVRPGPWASLSPHTDRTASANRISPVLAARGAESITGSDWVSVAGGNGLATPAVSPTTGAQITTADSSTMPLATVVASTIGITLLLGGLMFVVIGRRPTV